MISLPAGTKYSNENFEMKSGKGKKDHIIKKIEIIDKRIGNQSIFFKFLNKMIFLYNIQTTIGGNNKKKLEDSD